MAHSVEGNRFQVSAPPPAKKTAGLIEKETDVRRSICLLFNPGPAIEAANLIIKKTVPFWRSFIQGVRKKAEAQCEEGKSLRFEVGGKKDEINRGFPAKSFASNL
jgi:hypothetical protein